MGRYLGPLTKVSRRLGVFVGGDLESFSKEKLSSRATWKIARKKKTL